MLCFRKFPVAKKFMDKSRGEYQDFSSKFFCLTVSKNFVRKSFIVSLIPISKKLGIRELGGIRNFPSILFCPRVPKHFSEEPSGLCFKTFPVEKKI